MFESVVVILVLFGILYVATRRRMPTSQIDGDLAGVRAELRHLTRRLDNLEVWAAQIPGSSFDVLAGLPATAAPPPRSPVVSSGSGQLSPATTPRPAPPRDSQPDPQLPPPFVSPPVEKGALHAAPKPDGAPATPKQASPVGQPPTPAQLPTWSASSIEQMLSGRGLAWAGGLALLLGALFFLGLAFTRGWIGPAARVTIGLAAGAALTAGGSWFFHRAEQLFGHVLVAVGVGTVSLSIIAATRLYGLFLPSVGLLWMLLMAVIVAGLALRVNSQVVAAYGLLAALAAPPLLHAAPDTLTIGFLATTLIGTTIVALYRSWIWLPPAAFGLVAPQVMAWVAGRSPLALGLAALSGFWLLNAVAAGGEQFRNPRRRLHGSSTSLVVTNALFVVAAGLLLLDQHNAARYQGVFVLLVAVAHAVLGGYFLRTRGADHPFGLLVAATGIAALTLAIPIQFGAHLVPLGWAAEAVALLWVAERRKHTFSRRAAIVLGVLTTLHILLWEYPLNVLDSATRHHLLFMSKQGMALGFVLLAWAVAARITSSRRERTVIATTAAMLLIYALPFETAGLALYFGWASVLVLGTAINRVARQAVLYTIRDAGGQTVPLPSWIAGGLALLTLVSLELPFITIGMFVPSVPFHDLGSGAVFMLTAAALASALLTQNRSERRWLIAMVVALLAYLMPFELTTTPTVVAWTALGFTLVIMARLDQGGAEIYLPEGALMTCLSLLVTLSRIAPLSRLMVDSASSTPHSFLWSTASVALGINALSLALSARLFRSRAGVHWVAIAAGALVVYLASVGLVDEFQAQVVPGSPVLEIQRQAQVALSILWATIGGGVFAAGVVRWRGAYRGFGLALLALATTKVFVYDLASLDAAYRVLSFIGLGVLLLISSYIYQHLDPASKRTKG